MAFKTKTLICRFQKKSRLILYCQWFAISYTKEEWPKLSDKTYLFERKKYDNLRDVI